AKSSSLIQSVSTHKRVESWSHRCDKVLSPKPYPVTKKTPENRCDKESFPRVLRMARNLDQ
ncbi:hypothetical protein MUP59_05105, partial [Candidatus Bathyarchaeota archaeon]|nr:hypothetical protein [Candidatus Bathyarchaeota archaeon]